MGWESTNVTATGTVPERQSITFEKARGATNRSLKITIFIQTRERF